MNSFVSSIGPRAGALLIVVAIVACGSTHPAVAPTAVASSPATAAPKSGSPPPTSPDLADDGFRGEDAISDREPTCQREVPVTGGAALAPAIAAARPGDCLILDDGDYTFPVVSRTATAEAPIVIRARNRGKATVSSGSVVLDHSAYVTVAGMLITSGGNVQFNDSHHCRLSRSQIKPGDNERPEIDWIDIEGTSHHIRIDHNELGPKTKLSNMLMLGGKDPQVVQFNRIDHNYFHDIAYGGGNGWETIRAGLSFLAPSKAFTTIEYNLFRNTAGDPETISIKSSDNEVRYNTFLDVPGELTLRHGNRNRIHGNYIIGHDKRGTGGIRVCGSEHRIYNNYVSGVRSGAAIFLEGGDGDGIDVPGKQHYRVYRTEVVNNTVVGNDIQVGGAHPLPPVDCTVANNLIQGGHVKMGGQGTRFMGNLTGGSLVAASEIVHPPTGEVLHLPAGSPAIDASVGRFPYVTDDIDGQPRTNIADVGADELSTAPSHHAPLTEKDVGPDAP